VKTWTWTCGCGASGIQSSEHVAAAALWVHRWITGHSVFSMPAAAVEEDT